ncbi:MAG: (2Fe-2S)-binding protein [Proteobacteria bacterium]|nr:(2Fe-2S)-binding protein [Pseudomonadota bacterium]
MIVCLCNRVSERDIHDVVTEFGVRDFATLQDATGAATCCGRCGDCAREVLEAACAKAPLMISAPGAADVVRIHHA